MIRAMKKLLTTAALSLLLVSLAGGVYGQSEEELDFQGTKILAEQGDAFAQTILGVMYANGNGVPENDSEAVKWYRLAAEQGFAGAQSFLAFMYEKGHGVPENDAEAIKWYRLAAEQGMPDAHYNLGLMYAQGHGTPEDLVRAYMWFSVVAAQGGDDGRNSRDVISERLTPEQLARGQDIATRCFESDYQDCE